MTKKEELQKRLALFHLQLTVIERNKDDLISKRGKRWYDATVNALVNKMIEIAAEIKNL